MVDMANKRVEPLGEDLVDEEQEGKFVEGDKGELINYVIQKLLLTPKQEDKT